MADRTFYQSAGNIPYERDITFKFFVDAANQPTLATGAGVNNYVSSVTRTALGTYVLTLADPYQKLVSCGAELNVNTPVAAWVQVGPAANFGQAASAGLPTITIFTVDNASAATNPPAANANVFISGVAICCDTSGQ